MSASDEVDADCNELSKQPVKTAVSRSLRLQLSGVGMRRVR